jgi:hypothetical protein
MEARKGVGHTPIKVKMTTRQARMPRPLTIGRLSLDSRQISRILTANTAVHYREYLDRHRVTTFLLWQMGQKKIRNEPLTRFYRG